MQLMLAVFPLSHPSTQTHYKTEVYIPLHAIAESLVKGRACDIVSMETHTPPPVRLK